MHAIAGEALHARGHARAAIEALEQASSYYDAVGDRARYADVRNQIVRIRGNYRLTTEWDDRELARLVALANESRDGQPRLAARLYDTISVRSMYARRAVDACTYAFAAVDAVEREPPCTEQVLAAIQCAVAEQRLLRLASARGQLRRATAVAHDVADRSNRARAYLQSAPLDLVMGDFDALTIGRAALARDGVLVTDTGESSLASAAFAAANVLQGLSDDTAAFEQDLDLIRSTGYPWALARRVATHVAAKLAADNTAAALRALDVVDADAHLTSARALHPGLSSQLRLLCRRHDMPTGRRAPIALPPQFQFTSYRGGEFDIETIASFCLDVEVALACDCTERVGESLAALAFAEARGARFCYAWPVTIAGLLARGYLARGETAAAAHFATLAIDRLGSAGLRQALATLLPDIAPLAEQVPQAFDRARALFASGDHSPPE